MHHTQALTHQYFHKSPINRGIEVNSSGIGNSSWKIGPLARVRDVPFVIIERSNRGLVRPTLSLLSVGNCIRDRNDPEAMGRFQGALGRPLAVSKSSPDLKSDQNFSPSARWMIPTKRSDVGQRNSDGLSLEIFGVRALAQVQFSISTRWS